VSSLILRAATRVLAPMMLMLSLFLLWRGHNLPGGGFIGGLVATSAIALQGIAFGPEAARRTLVLPPAVLAAFGLLAAVLATLPAALVELPFFTGLWLKLDLGVFLVVIGGVCAILLALEEDPETDRTEGP